MGKLARRSGGPAPGPRSDLLIICCTLILLGDALPGGVHATRFQDLHFTSQPSDALLLAGATTTLHCAANPTLQPTVRWRCLDELPADQSKDMGNGSLQLSAAAHCQCLATVPGVGTIASRMAQVSVWTRNPLQPAAVSVHLGDSTLLPCGLGEVRRGLTEAGLLVPLRWMKDGKDVRIEDWVPDGRVALLVGGDLLLLNSTWEDAGRYRCLAGTGRTMKLMSDITLAVLTEPGTVRGPALLKRPKDVVVVASEAVTMECAAEGFPTPTVHWLKGEDSNLRFHGEMSERRGILDIGRAQEGDGGLYSCVVKSGNKTLHHRAHVTVLVAPRILEWPEIAKAEVGSEVTLQCEATGRPPPLVSWLHNGDNVSQSDGIRMVGHSLVISGLVEADDGIYQCVAENAGGWTQTSTQLHVQKPMAPLGLRASPPRGLGTELILTRQVQLHWRAPTDSYGSIVHYVIYYSRHGSTRERVVETAGDALQATVQGLQPGNSYTFRIATRTMHGIGMRSRRLQVVMQDEVQVPSLVMGLQAFAVSPTAVNITWEPPLRTFGPILRYKLSYMEKETDRATEQTVDIKGLSYLKDGLKKFTQYGFWVVAYNTNGPGTSSVEVDVRTLSDVPSAPPQGVVVEVVNAQSILVRWQAPPTNTHNGEITGYKIHYRKAGQWAEAEIEETAHLNYLAMGLDKGMEYNFRVAAVNSNGTGPFSPWLAAETFKTDLDDCTYSTGAAVMATCMSSDAATEESRVPDQPSSLHVRPLPTSIVVSWTPPANPELMVRGYAIGYGIGSPHGSTVRVDNKQRYYTIENLEPSSQYVISLKAFNNMGEGVPLYESAMTRAMSVPDPPVHMLPPVGVQASVVSHDTVRLTWADNSLPRNQRIPDARYYTVRWKTYFPANTKYKMANSTVLSYLVMGLKPSTLYEFAVMVTKNRRASTWSMTAHGTTLEIAPSSAPKDLTVVSREGKLHTALVNWQPPVEANGKITGYMIYYSADVTAQIHDWVVEPVVGDRLSHQIQELTLDTLYYFCIQARNAKGTGPISEPVHLHTPKAPAGSQSRIPSRSWREDARVGSHVPGQVNGSRTSSLDHTALIVIIVCVGIITIVAIGLVAVLCIRRSSAQHKKRAAASASKRKSHAMDLSPPDLWIHHERLEMHTLVKTPGNGEPTVTETPLSRRSSERHSIEPCTVDSHVCRNSYLDREGDEGASVGSRKTMRPNIIIPLEPQQPVYTLHATRGVEESVVVGEHEVVREDERTRTHSLGLMRPSATLSSFATPSTLASPLDVSTTPLLTIPGTSTVPTGTKTASLGPQGWSRTPLPVTVPSAPELPEAKQMMGDADDTDTQDDLSLEMASLEGLMKDLNAITSEF
uniref:neogenin-like isoform X2 n=1 Tax=Myxine glutinosa TaxID=7769 RepID=UPI00358F32F7